jgi:hypothetical protein
MDQAGVYSQIVDWLKDHPVVCENGGMQQSGASLGKKSTALVVRRVLHGFVTVAAEGEKALHGRKNEEIRNPLTTAENVDEVREKINNFLIRFADHMGDRFRDSDSIHLTRTGWEAIGMVAHEVMFGNQFSDDRQEQCITELANIDWSRTNRDLFGIIGMSEQRSDGSPALDEQGRERVVISGGKGDQGLRRAIAYLRKRLGIGRVPAVPKLILSWWREGGVDVIHRRGATWTRCRRNVAGHAQAASASWSFIGPMSCGAGNASIWARHRTNCGVAWST